MILLLEVTKLNNLYWFFSHFLCIWLSQIIYVYTSYDFWKNSTTQILTIILHDKRLFTNTVLLNQIPKQSQQLSELLFKTTAANKRWYLKQKKFDLRFTTCTSFAGGGGKAKQTYKIDIAVHTKCYLLLGPRFYLNCNLGLQCSQQLIRISILEHFHLCHALG